MLREEVSVLVVDDVNTMRTQIKLLLKSFGFRHVSLASHGEEAMHMILNGTFHLILADWQMAPMNGLDLLRFVRTNEAHKNACFIMVTADNTKENVIGAIQLGVDDYLLKPLTADSIQNKVYGVLLKKGVLA